MQKKPYYAADEAADAADKAAAMIFTPSRPFNTNFFV